MAKGANKAAFDRATRTFRAAFQSAFETNPGRRVLDMLTYRPPVSSKRTTEHFPVLDGVDVPEHRDQLHYAAIRWFELETLKKVYAKGLRFKREDFEDDNYEHHAQLGRQLARHLRVTQRRMSIDYLVRGFTGTYGTSFDGQLFFDTDHFTVGGTWSNDHSLALSTTNFDTLYSSLLSTPTPDGDQLYEAMDGEIQVDLIVGPNLTAAADEVMKNLIAGGETNPRSTRINKVVLNDLRAGGPFDAYKNYWFLQAANENAPEIKPLTFVGDETPELTFKMDPDDEDAFERDELAVKVRGRFGFGYRAPWGIQGSTGA